MNEYHIHNLLSSILDDDLFITKYNCMKTCSLCFNFQNNLVHTPPYLSINVENIIDNNNSLVNIIYNKFKMVYSACPNCSYEGKGKDKNLKKEEKYKYCLLQNYSNINLPKFLFFCFELSDEMENDDAQYHNLIKYRNNILNLIVEFFEFNGIKWSLLGIICMPKINHYSSFCCNCLNDSLNLIKGHSYYYDDMYNDGEVQLIDNSDFNKKIEKISKFNPFIIVYGEFI